jgi:hypothetical protein
MSSRTARGSSQSGRVRCGQPSSWQPNASIALRSRTFIPAYVNPASNDPRELGVAVSCLQIDDSQISLEDDPTLAEGCERRGDDGHRRWTTGYTALPSGTRLIVIDLAGRGYYWEEQEEANRIALVG